MTPPLIETAPTFQVTVWALASHSPSQPPPALSRVMSQAPPVTARVVAPMVVVAPPTTLAPAAMVTVLKETAGALSAWKR